MKLGPHQIKNLAHSIHQRRFLVGFLLLATFITGICNSISGQPASFGLNDNGHPGGLKLEESAPPSINQPGDRRVLLNAVGITITWTITDPENSSGTYLVAHDNFDPWENIGSLPSMMRSWVNNTPFNVPVDTSLAGAHNYTILFSDMSQAQLIAAAIGGVPISWGTDTVWITVETPPVVQVPDTLRIHRGETGRVLAFSIIDPDSPTGLMNVTMNGSITLPLNTQWNASQVVSIPLNASSLGYQHFTFVVTDGNYTVNHLTTVWVALNFPPEIQNLANLTVSPDIGVVPWAFTIVDMENTTGNYTILREGQVFNATFTSATWTNGTAIYLNYSLNETGWVDFQVIAEDLIFDETRQDFFVYVNIPPTATAPLNSTNYYREGPHEISWTIFDADNLTGTQVLEITTPLGSVFRLANSSWQSGVPLSTLAYTSNEGTWNYTMFFSDGYTVRHATTFVTILPARLLDETGITMVLLAFIAAGLIGVGSIMAHRNKKN
jgi:hypothetical protein